MSDFSENNVKLILALKVGKTNAYSYLIDCYSNKLLIYANTLCNNQDLAQDIVQNVFIKIWQKRDKLKTEIDLQGFLYKSVYNEFIDQYRKIKSQTSLEEKYIAAINLTIEETDESNLNTLINLVKQEIKNLPPKCKETFILSKENGLTNNEIADHLGVSIKSVEAHITKAFAIIRKQLSTKINSVLLLIFG